MLGDIMMIDPKSYKREFENSSLDKILQERDRIIEFMHDYENENLPEKYYERDPSPEVVYFTNVLYLKEICDLIISKMNERDSKPKVAPFLAIEEVLSKFDSDKQDEFLDELKVKDEKLYTDYMQWKMNGG